MRKHTQHYTLLAGLLLLIVLAGDLSSRRLASLLSDLLPEQNQALRDERDAVQAALSAAAESAGTSNGTAPQAQANRQAGLQARAAADATIGQIMQHKRAVRLQWATQRDLAATVRSRYGVDATNEAALRTSAAAHRTLFSGGIRRLAHQIMQQADQPLLFQLLTASFGQQLNARFAYRALASVHAVAVHELTAVQTVPQTLATLVAEHAALQTSYHAAQTAYDRADQQVALSDDTLAEIKRIVAAVEGKIRQMQVTLQEYDERIRLQAEKELVAKGLRAPREEGYKAPTFIWPVAGAITAGFYEPSYQRHFGVPHKAIDIRQSQGNAVHAAATGIVYYVQHGGKYGYSYVLIGHRGGYATLYGHLSGIYVAAGAEVKQGAVIGASGGTPGTPGAGPMTTGAHVHFEVIKDGVHVNPTTVLP